MADDADLVGFIVRERDDGWYVYGCDDHCRDADLRWNTSRHVLRDEAREEGATCDECGLELAEAVAIDA